jgi:hypothetical protein
MGGVSVGVLVGKLKSLDYCTNILSYSILEHVPDKSIVMELSAVDPKFVIRPEVRIVAGWYTWLCADMVGSMLLGQAGYNGLTQCLNIDLVKTYRTPILVGKGVVVSIVDNVWTIDIELSNSSGTVVSTATGAFKGFKRELI